MSSDSRDEGLARRIQDLYATDAQCAAARPDGTTGNSVSLA